MDCPFLDVCTPCFGGCDLPEKKQKEDCDKHQSWIKEYKDESVSSQGNLSSVEKTS